MKLLDGKSKTVLGQYSENLIEAAYVPNLLAYFSELHVLLVSKARQVRHEHGQTRFVRAVLKPAQAKNPPAEQVALS